MDWDFNWLWSIPLILLTVTVHVFGLGYVAKRIVLDSAAPKDRRQFMFVFCTVVGTTTLLATLLLGFHATTWAIVYLALGAMPDLASAMLYSLSALTSYGHAELFLEKHWQMMGALEAVNGGLLFGLTTAFLFAAIQAVWPINRR
jgi:hypothetical protein